VSVLKSIPNPEPSRETVANVGPAVVKLSAAEIAQLARRQRARSLMRRLAMWVLLPTAISAVYLFAVAKNQFESIATTMVRGGSPAHIAMVHEFLMSRDVLAKLEASQHFSDHFKKRGDLIFGMSKLAGSETRYKVFRRFTSVGIDATTGVVTVSARAFDPKVARDAVQTMVNETSRFLAALEPSQPSPLVVIAQPSLPNRQAILVVRMEC
jgi:capsule polysaccharide export protein KpsE/RkpR